ncbi:Holliday junction branch migration protein RuvA [Bacillota bacterium Meth-B3]|nr:Holliday junction branch migration protein RuvA [Christensenellaceae bacterium]MEA5064859.1 Holliday junction branch migration protein RuvA [Eubacteriales bacterium]
MYAHIQGLVAEKTSDALVIDAGGVGYWLSVSAGTLAAAPAVGSPMKCYTVLSVREDAMELFGFATREEKAMFEKLKSVSGVGARMSLNILSALSVRELSIALVTGDSAALTRAPGIGKKTAQRLVLELRDKVDDCDLTGAPATTGAPVRSGGIQGEAIEALMALGYASSEAAKAVASVADKAATLDETIRLALRGMVS